MIVYFLVNYKFLIKQKEKRWFYFETFQYFSDEDSMRDCVYTLTRIERRTA